MAVLCIIYPSVIDLNHGIFRSHNISSIVHVCTLFYGVYSNVVKTPPSLSVVPGLLGE